MNIHLIVGSQMGAAEYVADELCEALQALDHQATIHEKPVFDDIPRQDVYWLVCTSTHGAGDLPDNIQPFVKALLQNQPKLDSIQYGVIALGDRSYDTFCRAGHYFSEILDQLGAKKIGEVLEINVLDQALPEETALEWLPNWLKLSQS